MELATYIITALAVLLSAHAVMYAMVIAWHNSLGEGATLLERLDDGVAKAAAMRTDPPWYVRYTDWLERKVLRRG